MSLEMAHKMIVPQKKIISRSFLNSGTLIVQFSSHNLLAINQIRITRPIHSHRFHTFTSYIITLYIRKKQINENDINSYSLLMNDRGNLYGYDI